MWGSNYFLMNGHLANNPGGSIERPQRVRGLKDVVAISAGAAHAVALTRTGRVIVWGSNTFEQLGQPQAYVMATIPIRGVIKVFAGGDNTFVIRRGGAVWAWGRGIEHRLPSGSLEKCFSSGDPCSSVPVQVRGLHHVVSIGAGDGFDYALRRSGELFAWGDNSFGQLGRRGAPKQQRFVRVPLPGRVIEVRAGLNVGLAVVRLRHRTA
jgi:alpha-tubulin suppressor-like RCC1 family protein